MEQNRNGKGSGGFTLVETLLVTAILVILLGLSLVGAAYYRDYLKITELDNEAREIFMAAENRAVLLENSGESVSLLGEKTEGSTVMLSNREAADSVKLADLLPAGVIDPALREGHFFILYDAGTHHVTEVFYAKKDKDIDGNLDDFRGKSRTERVLLFRGGRTLVGWYGGGKAANIGTKPLPSPGVEVLINNGEELTLTVVYTMPEGLPAGVTVDRTPKVTLEYGGKEIDLWTNGRKTGGPDITLSTTTSAKYVWVLDSLEDDKQFKGLVSADLGGDFTVTAGLTLHVDPAKLAADADKDGYIDSAYYAQGTDNSLFAKETGDGNTAYIANVRHLQNLHRDHSGVASSIVNAEQLCDVDCKGGVYNFIPIANGALTSYNGREKIISGLRVSCSGDAGLFGFVTSEKIIIEQIRLFSPRIISTGAATGGESNAAPLLARVDEGACTLSDIEIINGSAESATYAGGLVGLVNQKASCSLENCRVYWNTPKDLVKGSASKQVNYVISGNCAGGLIGYASGGAVITGSFAATTVDGGTSAGGLAGRANSLTVSGSYADCYLTGSGMTGELVGQSQAALNLTNCYAAGFIMEPGDGQTTAGLANGTNVTAKNCYSVVRVVRDGKLKRPAAPLYGSAGAGSGSVRYVCSAADVTGQPFGTAFEYEDAKPETHIYNLRHRLDGSVKLLTPPYPFPGLKDLPHYGDWAELNAGLVYYETYGEDSHGVWGVQEDGTRLDTLEETPPVQDGYALVFEGEEAPKNYTIQYGDGVSQTWTLENLKWSGTTKAVQPIRADLGGETCTLVPLPDAIVTGELPKGDALKFYQKLTCGTDADRKTYWFNPHFAKTVNQQDDMPTSSPVSPASPVFVRTPRHFYDLSSFQGSYVNSGKTYYFLQELDLDYAAYSWYGSSQPGEGNGGASYKQLPIGKEPSVASSFRGTYDGGCHKIKNVFISTESEYRPPDHSESDYKHLGLFGGVNSTSGGLKNIVYELDPERVETVVRQASAQNFGTLAGNLQQGSITNCAVYGANIRITGFNLGTCGGLVGSNAGTIADCSAELVSLEVENCWAGGLVGSSGGPVANSYAVGKIIAAGEGIGASGLVNESNDGSITNCYAAVFLTTTEQRRGLCNLSNKIDENSGFLTGTFKYRGETYTVDDTYVGPGRRIPPAQLADIIPGLSKASAAIHYDISDKDWKTDYEGGGKEAFPYLTGVKNAEDQPVHYGLWPVADATPALPAPGVKVLIKNGEELTLTVEYTVPKEGVPGDVACAPDVTLNYQGKTVSLLCVNAEQKVESPFAARLTDDTKNSDVTKAKAGDTVVYTWVLDSLKQDNGGTFTQQFNGLGLTNLGGDFTVTAKLKLTAPGYTEGKFSAEDTNNSLFHADTHDGSVAYISNLRHLQNLDSDTTKAAGKTEARQLNDIDAGTVKNNENVVQNAAYAFRPIANKDLLCYDGQKKTISRLNVTAESAAGKEGSGLFSNVKPMDSTFTFKSVRLADSNVVAGEYTYIDNGEEKKGIAPTGALLGYLLSSVTFDDCQVVNTGVWGTTSLAGGMAGQMWASSDKTVEFTNCTAEGLTVDSWSSYAGGLLGWSGGGGAARFDNCKVGTNGNAFTVSGTNAGGLLGNAGGKATFTSCTVGRLGGDSKVSITKGTYVGGLVGNLSQPSEIDRCEVVNIKVEGNDWNSEAGGLVGRTERSTEGGTVLTNCTAKNLSVKGSTNAGGMLGGAIGVQMGFKSDDTSAPCSVSNVTVVADTGSVGGLVGNSKDGKFDGCTADNANVSVSGGSSCEAGGLVGSATGDSFRSCSTTNAVISAACFSGGLVGSSKSGGSFDQCTAANVRIPSINGGTTYVGGLVGFSIEGGTFTDCKVINAQMVPSATYAGGMVGSAARHALKNCQVYWDQSGLAQISRESYQVNGETAGGLVGTIRESGTIEASFAATLVKGTVYAGGLVGHIGSAAISVTVERSYADCYIHNEGTKDYATTGGLIGVKEAAGTELILKNVYAAGFIYGKGRTAGGLCGGEFANKIAATNAYAAMRYQGAYTYTCALAGMQGTVSSTNCYWFATTSFNTNGVQGTARNYTQMSSLNMGGDFEKKTAGNSNPYWNTGLYPFPSLKVLPHYGDWPTS